MPMKLQMEHQDTPEVQVILRGRPDSQEMLRLLALLQAADKKLCAWDAQRRTVLLVPQQVVWCEMVDEKVFVYTRSDLYQTSLGLGELESQWEDAGFFRCAKSAVVNIHQIRSLASCPGGRIEALLSSGEKLIISRRYAPLLRDRLKSF